MTDGSTDDDTPALMEIGYDLDRVRRLAHATSEAVEALRAIGSDDPAALEALDAVRLARRNLEDHWMPVLRRIAASRALTAWSAGGPDPVTRSGPRRSGRVDPQRRALDRELLDSLLHTLHELASHDPADRPADTELAQLANEVARRAHRSDVVADRLVELAGLTPSIALLTSFADFPHDVAVAALAGALTAAEPVGAMGTRHHLEAVAAAMNGLLDDPRATLDVLLVPGTLAALGSWKLLDQDLVHEFVVTALHDAVADDPARRRDGYRVLTDLTQLAGAEFDGGMQPGLARGVAASMTGYVDTLGPAVRREGSHEVVVMLDEETVVMGTYDDVAGLFGAILRDPVAQVSVGIAAGAYAAAVVDDRGVDVVRGNHLARVTRFADLLGDATRSEHAELVVAAAATEAAHRKLGVLIGLGANAGLTVAGVGSVLRSATGPIISAVTDRLADVDPGRMPGRPIPAAIYDVVTTSAIAMVARDPTVRSALGLGGVTRSQWRSIGARLDEIERTDDPVERSRHVLRLERHIEDDVPALDHYLREVRDVENLDELTEDRRSGG